MSTWAEKVAADKRTCTICGEGVASSLRGYMGSLLVCEGHLLAWNTSQARSDAMLAAFRGDGNLLVAFNDWAQRMKEAK